MGKVFVIFLEGKIYSCKHCGTHLALSEDIMSKNYETAQEKSQKYKEGKSVLERFKICGPDGGRYWVGHDMHSAGSDADDA